MLKKELEKQLKEWNGKSQKEKEEHIQKWVKKHPLKRCRYCKREFRIMEELVNHQKKAHKKIIIDDKYTKYYKVVRPLTKAETEKRKNETKNEIAERIKKHKKKEKDSYIKSLKLGGQST